MSFFDLINPFSYATPLHADGSEPTPDSEDAAIVAPDVVEEPAAAAEEAAEDEVEEATEEEEEEAEAEDHAPIIREECGATMACKSLKHHYEECAARVEAGSAESCAEEFLHFMECVGECAAEKIFAKCK
ncbi:ubiquinol--cytochrome-c reductase subunit 6 [Coemansia nantahalensis]|nr:ubiquinol--cytochrome-c reductase subunit 6 [Coemansia nantahalensis]